MRSSEAKERFRQARTLHAEARYEDALELLDLLGCELPPNADLEYFRARCLAHLDEPDEVRRIASLLTEKFGDPRGVKVLAWFAPEPEPVSESLSEARPTELVEELLLVQVHDAPDDEPAEETYLDSLLSLPAEPIEAPTDEPDFEAVSEPAKEIAEDVQGGPPKSRRAAVLAAAAVLISCLALVTVIVTRDKAPQPAATLAAPPAEPAPRQESARETPPEVEPSSPVLQEPEPAAEVVLVEAAFDEVRALPAASLLTLPANYIDLQNVTLRFVPLDSGAYEIHPATLDFQEETGEPLRREEAAATRPATAWLKPLPFSFPFGGASWNGVYVNLHGNLTFGYSESAAWRHRDPHPGGTLRSVAAAIDSRAAAGMERMLAALWAVYDPAATSVSVNARADRFVVTWEAHRPQANIAAGENVFQVSLFPSGVIEYSYLRIADLDGIVGVFPGIAWGGETLAHIDDPDEAANPYADIVSLEVRSTPSVIEFVLTTGAAIPARVPDGKLVYRMAIELPDRDCQFGLSVTDTSEAWSDCGPAPNTIGMEFEGERIYAYLSRSVLKNVSEFSLDATVEWEGRAGTFDHARSPGPIKLPASKAGEIDLSSPSGPYLGNTYEIFHHPALSHNATRTLQHLYQRYPANDELAVLFTDFRFDSIAQGGARAEPLFRRSDTVPAHSPLSGDRRPSGFGRLRVAAPAVFAGAPLFSPTTTIDGREFYGYGVGLGWIGHVIAHGWGPGLHIKNSLSGRTEALAGEHWLPELHNPAIAPVAEHFTDEPYPEASTLGGSIWIEDPDGAFTASRQPEGAPAGLSALDLYGMGLLAPEDVSESFLLTDIQHTETGGIHARKIPIRGSDLLEAASLFANQAPAELNLSVYLLHEPGRAPHPDMLIRVQRLSAQIPWYLDLASGGRMRVLHSPGPVHPETTVKKTSSSPLQTRSPQ